MFSYCIDTEKVEHLVDFEKLKAVKQLIYLDGSIYLLGNRTYTVNSNPSDYGYESEGEQILCYTCSEQQVYELKISQPITMSVNEDRTLMIYAYDTQNGDTTYQQAKILWYAEIESNG